MKEEEILAEKMLSNGLKQIIIHESFIPSPQALKQLVFVSKREGDSTMEKAILMAHRLPSPGNMHTAHIIAVHEKPADNSYTSLYSWNFNSLAEAAGQKSLEELVQNLQKQLYRLPNVKTEETPDEQKVAYENCLTQGYVPLPHFTRTGQQIMSCIEAHYYQLRSLFYGKLVLVPILIKLIFLYLQPINGCAIFKKVSV